MSNPQYVDATQALRLVQSGDRVYLHEAAMAPFELIDALCERAMELTGIETVSMHTEGPAPHVDPRLAGAPAAQRALRRFECARGSQRRPRGLHTGLPVAGSRVSFADRCRSMSRCCRSLHRTAHGFCRLGAIGCLRARRRRHRPDRDRAGESTGSRDNGSIGHSCQPLRRAGRNRSAAARAPDQPRSGPSSA